MLNVPQFRQLVVRPVLNKLEAYSAEAELLLLGTALAESGLSWLKQLGSGPALGVYQMEPATHDDIWQNYLQHRDWLSNRVAYFASPFASKQEQLVWNLGYATAMCRVHYLRVPEPIPALLPQGTIGDKMELAERLAQYWKRYYNTEKGRGDPGQFKARLYAQICI